MAFSRVTSKSDLPAGQVRVFQVGTKSIALGHINGDDFYAVDNVCTHDGGPLGEGRLVDGQVECPRHGARFDIKTGRVTVFPAVMPVRTYPVRLDGEEVSVDVG